MLIADANSFGVLRLAMAMAVLISHCFYLSTGQMTAEPLIGWTGYTLGQHGVQIFFILSGVLVAQSLTNSRSIVDFVVARTLRIFPALLVCVLFVALLLGPAVSSLSATGYFINGDVLRYMGQTVSLMTGSATLPGVFVDLPAAGIVNSSLWTLKYEAACYVLLAAIGWVVLRSALERLTGAMLLLTGVVIVVSYQPSLSEGNGFLANLRYFGLFFGTGILAFVMRHRLPVTGLVLLPLLGLMTLAIGTPVAEVSMAAALGYGALWLSSWRMGPLRQLANRNDYSYGVYIYGVPVTQSILSWFPDAGVAVIVVVTILIVLPLAALSWNFIEKPALNWRRNISAKLRTVEVALRSQPLGKPRPW